MSSKTSSAKYYQDNKERLQKSLSKEEKEKKQQYGRECYKNISEDEIQKLLEYRRKVLQDGETFYHNHKKLFSFRHFFLEVELVKWAGEMLCQV